MNTHRRPLTTLLLVGGGLIVYAGLTVSSATPGGSPNAIWAILLGLPFFMVGLITFQKDTDIPWFDPFLERAGQWLGVTKVQVVLLALSPLFGYICILGAGFGQKMYSPGWAVVTWIVGMGLAFLGGWRSGEEPPRMSRSTFVTLTLLIVLAFLVRGIATEKIPSLLTGDEGSSGISAMDFVKGESNNIFVTGWFSFPSFFSYIQSLSIRLFGQTTAALRLVSALAGALTVGCVYLFGRSLFGQRAALFAALTLAAMHFHIHFSRIGLNNIWDGLWYTIAVGALCLGWESNKRWAYLVAGLALGFGLYFYVSTRAMFVMVLVGILIAAIFQRKRLQQALPDLFLMLLVTLAVIFPVAWFFLQHPDQFIAPMDRVSFFKILGDMVESSGQPAWQILADQIGKGLQAYTLLPIRFWYNPETPILRPIFASFFYLGLALLLFRYRDSRFLMAFLWLGMFGLMGGLSESVPAAQRYVAAAPACALVVGLGLHGTTELFETLWQKFAKIFTGLSYVVICIAVLSDLNFYFFDYYGNHLLENINSNGMIAQHVANQVKDKPAGTQVAFFSVQNMGFYSIPSIQYLAPQVQGVDVPEPWSTFDRTLLKGGQIVFIIPVDRADEVLEVTREYPNGYLYSDTSWNGELLFWVYELP